MTAMRTIARILAPLLVLAGLMAGTQGHAQADTGRDYAGLTRTELIAELEVTTANLNSAMASAQMWRDSNNVQWRRAYAAEREVAAVKRDLDAAALDLATANRDLAHATDTARVWEQSYRAAYAEAQRFVALAEDYRRQLAAANRTIARRDARIARLVAKVAALKARR